VRGSGAAAVARKGVEAGAGGAGKMGIVAGAVRVQAVRAGSVRAGMRGVASQWNPKRRTPPVRSTGGQPGAMKKCV